MKKLAPLFLVACALVFAPSASFSQNDAPKTNLNCPVDIAASLPTAQDWSEIYIIRDENGGAWQRAPLRDHHRLMLDDASNTVIQGTANSYADVQLYIFAPQDNGAGGLRKPDLATCFNIGKADKEGKFDFEFNSRLLWSLLGTEVVVDAFYKMEDGWETTQDLVEGQNFFIGTHSYPSRPIVEAIGDPKNCPLLCDSSNMIEGVSMDPATLDPKLLGANFDELGGKRAVVARAPGEHTFYAGSTGDNNRDQEMLAGVAMKSLAMERLKRAIQGNEFAGNVPPGIVPLDPESIREAANGQGNASRDVKRLLQMIRTIMTGDRFHGTIDLKTGLGVPTPTPANGFPVNPPANGFPVNPPAINPPLTNIDTDNEAPSNLLAKLPSAENLPNVPNAPSEVPYIIYDENGETVNLAQQVQRPGGAGAAPPTGQQRPKAQPKPKSSNQKAAKKPKSGGNKDGGKKKKNSNGKGPAGGAPAPPPGKSSEEVYNEFDDWLLPAAPPLGREIFPIRTSSNETWPQDLLDMIDFWTGGLEKNECLALDDPNFQESIKTDGQISIDADYICQYAYVGGLTPQILINKPEAVFLEPKFVDARIVEADVAFTSGEGWQLAAGEKNPINYRYEFTDDFSKSRVGNLCTKKANLDKAVDAVASVYDLRSAEAAVLASELNKETKDVAADDYVSLSLADPQDIAERFVWEGNNEKLNILGLFFEVKVKGCADENTDLPFSPNVPSARDGFEAGILQ